MRTEKKLTRRLFPPLPLSVLSYSTTQSNRRAQTEYDFAEIAAAGLNWIRLPFPFWAIETWPGEPFLEHVAWECESRTCFCVTPFLPCEFSD